MSAYHRRLTGTNTEVLELNVFELRCEHAIYFKPGVQRRATIGQACSLICSLERHSPGLNY